MARGEAQVIETLAKCQRCGAGSGEPCRQPKGKRRGPHAGRVEAGLKIRLWRIESVAEKMRDPQP